MVESDVLASIKEGKFSHDVSGHVLQVQKLSQSDLLGMQDDEDFIHSVICEEGEKPLLNVPASPFAFTFAATVAPFAPHFAAPLGAHQAARGTRAPRPLREGEALLSQRTEPER